MNTIKYKGVEIHVGCEGTIIKGVCLRCGEVKPKHGFFGPEPLVAPKPKFDKAAYKKRIRNLEDLK